MAAQLVSCGSFSRTARGCIENAPRVSDFVPVSMSCGLGANAGRRDARDGRPMPPRVPCLQCPGVRTLESDSVWTPGSRTRGRPTPRRPLWRMLCSCAERH